MKKDNLIKKGNESLALGFLLGVGSAACPCPMCIVTSAAFVLNGIREKVSD